MTQSYDAIVLAGGAGRRLGGAGKAALEVGGRTLLEWVLAAAAGAERRIVVGPDPWPGGVVARGAPAGGLPDVVVVREQPPGGGPVRALRRGLAEVTAPLLVLLAADLPFLRAAHVEMLVASCGGADGAMLADDGGRPQWLAGCWRAAALRAALAGYAGDSMRGLLGPLKPGLVRVPGEPWRDCDTPEDLARARERYH